MTVTDNDVGRTKTAFENRKAPKLDGIFNFEVNIYPCNLKGRQIAKGKESEYRLPWQLWKKT